ncbi:Venom allergen [Gryllus bimaculatus]|nr:Venom allergen [Gryllus bimaculatus]
MAALGHVARARVKWSLSRRRGQRACLAEGRAAAAAAAAATAAPTGCGEDAAASGEGDSVPARRAPTRSGTGSNHSACTPDPRLTPGRSPARAAAAAAATAAALYAEIYEEGPSGLCLALATRDTPHERSAHSRDEEGVALCVALCVLLWLRLALPGAEGAAPAPDYCSLCDEPGSHTMCAYPHAGPAPNCSNYRPAPLSAREKRAIVRTHNLVRRRVATGRAWVSPWGTPLSPTCATSHPTLYTKAQSPFFKMLRNKWPSSPASLLN